MDPCMEMMRRWSMTIATMGLAYCLTAAVTCAQAKVINPVLVVPRLTVLAVPDFAAADQQLHQTAVDMARFIGPVLRRSCPVKLIDSDDIGGNAPGIDVDVPPDVSYWRSIKADIVALGRLMALADGRLRVEVRMWDVRAMYSPVQIYGKQFTASPDEMQRLSSVLAGDIFERLCDGDRGFLRTPE
jgi:TolB protein